MRKLDTAEFILALATVVVVIVLGFTLGYAKHKVDLGREAMKANFAAAQECLNRGHRPFVLHGVVLCKQDKESEE